MIDANVGKHLLGHKPKIYHRRWLVLLYVCCLNIVILCGWNIWGTIAQSMIYGFDWGNSTIADILNIGRIGVFVFLIPFNYVLDTKGLRPAIVVTSSLTLLCYVLRCFMDTSTSVGLAMISEVVVGASHCFAYSGPSIMSVTWFPPDERVTATAVAIMCKYIGFAIGYIIHPRIVSAPVFGKVTYVDQRYNLSTSGNLSGHDLDNHLFNATSQIVVLNKAEIQIETKTLIYAETGIAAFLWLVGILLIPKNPPTPPSASASADRLSYKRVFIEVSRNGYLVILVLYAGSLVGVYTTWIAVIDIAFEHLQVSQTEAGELGFYSIIAGSAVGFVCARFSDVFGRKLKIIQIVILTIGSLSFLWLSLICGQFITFSSAQLYTSSIIGCAFLNGCIPLLYEQMCEDSFPIPEGIIIGLSAMFSSIAAVIYLLPISVVTMTDTSWLEWVFFGIGVLGVIVLAVVPHRYGRADIDVPVSEKTSKRT